MSLKGPRRTPGLSLNVVATVMMVAAGTAAVLFIAVIAYVLVTDPRRQVAALLTPASDASPAGDSPAPTGAIVLTVQPLPGQQVHVVAQGETLVGIAALYNVPVGALKQLNHLTDPGLIYPGQQLIIPSPLELTPTASIVTLAPSLTPSLSPDDPANLGPLSGWPRSLAGGTPADLAANYPSVLARPRFTLHYQPGTYADLHINELVGLAEAALTNVETRLQVHLDGTFDLYAAGTLFTEDDINLRGLSKSKDRQLFILFDGTGEPSERAYAITHELTHLVVWNTWGPPASTMMSEGLATYDGRQELESGGYIPYDQLCLAIKVAGEMESMAAIDRDPKKFQGHIENRFNYFGAACFVGYLIDTYGLDTMSRLYHSADYGTLYGGKSLDALDAEWQSSLTDHAADLTIDPGMLVDMNRKVNYAYDTIFTNYSASPQMHQAYVAIDKARIALWRGDYQTTSRWLQEAYRLSGYQQP